MLYMINNDSHQHIVRTTAQWNDRAVEYWVVPRGCLCVELTPEGKTKLKVGEGNKFFSQLPYICDHEDLSNYYTKEEIDNLFNNLNRMAIVSTNEYPSKDALPSMGNKLGDVRFVKSSGIDPDIYVWNGSKWISTGSETDVRDFVTRSEFVPVKNKVDEIYPIAHTHDNKDILDSITQADRDKFDSLHNYDDTEIRELIEETGHTHPNKALLDTITQSSLWSSSDRDKFNDLHNYDDTQVKFRLTTVEEKAHTHANKDVLDGITQEKLDEINELAATYIIVKRDILDLKEKSHTHSNKNILDGTTASYTLEQRDELDRLSRIDVFIGAGPTWNGVFGYVPAPEQGQQTFFLRADGTWSKVKTGGDKYKAGEGIFILSGEVATETFPFKVYSKSAKLKQYVIYGAQGGVGTLVSSNPNVYSVPLTISSPDYGTRQTNILISDPLYAGDYIDYQRQVFVHTRTALPTSEFPVDPDRAYRQGVYSDGRIEFYYPGGGYADNPVVSLPYEFEPGASYEFQSGSSMLPDWQWNALGGAMNINLYDANMNRTRTVGLSFNNVTIVTPTASEKYMIFGGIKGNDMCMTKPGITKIKDVETPCVLQEVILYANTINTIDVDTSVKPSEMYVEVDDPPEDQPDDPLSNYTGIIYNDGVLDITQEDPTALNELTVHFRDNVDKTINIPTYSLPIATTTTLGGVIVGDGLSVDNTGEISIIDTYSEGVAIEFQQEYVPLTTLMEYVRWTITAKRNSSGQVLQASEFEIYDESDNKITLSNAVGTMVGKNPSFQHSGVMPAQLIDGNTGSKMRCLNFTTDLTITFTIQTPIAANLIKNYRYFTSDDTAADPITWTIQLSPDGETWYNVDQRTGEDITTSRNTATDFYTITKPTVPGGKSINVKYGDGLSLDENGALTVTGGSGGGNYDAGEAINFTTGTPSILPAEYQLVDYIESTGTQGIELNYVPAESCVKYDLTFSKMTYSSPDWYFILGGYDSGTTLSPPSIVYSFGTYPNKMLACIGSSRAIVDGEIATAGDTDTHKYIATFFDSSATLQLDSGQIKTGTYTGNISFKVGLFCCPSSTADPTAILGMSSFRFHELKIYEGSTSSNITLIHHYYPCYRISDNEPGIYDVVTDTFLPNTGAGDFIVGPNTLRDLINVQYGDGLEVDANNDLNVKLGSGLSFDTNDAITVDEMTGATDQTDGASGMVPAPLAGDENKFLRGDGTWSVVQSGSEYIAGDGIIINQAGTYGHPEYYFDTQVQCRLQQTAGSMLTRTYTKVNTIPALGAIMALVSPSDNITYYGPLFVSTDPDGVLISNNYNSDVSTYIDTVQYRGQTWYISSSPVWLSDASGGDQLGNVPNLSQTAYSGTDMYIDAAKALIDAADPHTTNEISANLGSGLQLDANDAIKVNLGSGLQFDANGAIETTATAYTAGTGIDIGGSIIYNKHRAIPSDQYREVLYIESNGTNYIMTDLTPASDTAYQLFWESLDLPDLSTQALVGTDTIVNGQHRNSAVFYEYYNNTVSFAMMSGNDSGVGTWATSVDSYLFNSGQILNAAPGQRVYQVFTCTYNNAGGYSNPTVRQTSGVDYAAKTNPQPFAIFGANTYDSDNDTHDVVNRSKYRYHWFVLFRGNQIATEYITHVLYPCYRLSDDRIGVYDVNTNVFYPANSNVGFILGADLVDIVPDTNNTISAKIGRGLTVDSIYGNITNAGVVDIEQNPSQQNQFTVEFVDSTRNKTITIPTGGSDTTYTDGKGITFTQPGLTDLGFDFAAYIATVSSVRNGAKTVDLEHETLTLTATGDDCYTYPYSNTSAQNVYTFPIVAGHVYRLTWDSSNPSVSGRNFAFENVSETNLHWVDQKYQDYLEFTAVTSGTVNFRFGVEVSGNAISYSNIHFYEVDNYDPDTNIINTDIAKGLEFDSLDKLQVSLGDGLSFDSNDAIELDKATDSTIGGVIVGTGLSVDNNGVVSADDYQAGRGIIIDSTLSQMPFSYSGFINGVTQVERGTIVKNNDDSFTLTATGDDCFTQPFSLDQGSIASTLYLFSPVAGNRKYRLTWTSSDRSIHGRVFVFENGRGSPLHEVDQATNEYLEFTTAAATTSLSFRFGVANTGDTLTYSNIRLYLVTGGSSTIEAKLGNGLQFDANGAIETTGGSGVQYVRVNTTDSFVLLHTKPADWDDNWHKYFELTYDEITTPPVDWDPTKHYKYENDNYVLGTAGDTFVSTTWYDKHYVGLDPNTAVTFDSDVYYTGELQLIEDGETFDTAFEKVNEAIEHIERLEQEVQYLQDDRVGVRVTNPSSENLEFYNK